MPNPLRSFRINDHRRRVASKLIRLFFGQSIHESTEPLPINGICRILICHVSHTVGNALLLTPLLQELELRYPGAEIDIITRSTVAQEIYGGYFNVNKIVRLPAHGVGHPVRFLGELRSILKKHYDLAIDPDPQSQTARLLLLMAKATWKLGFNGPRKSGHVTHAVASAAAPTQVGQRPVYLLRSALGVQPDLTYPVPDIRLTAVERNDGRVALTRLLRAATADSCNTATGKKGIIGIFANATGNKLLGNDWWIPFRQELEPACTDYHIIEIVPVSGRSMLNSYYPCYYSSDLRKLASVLSALTAYTSTDCGIMHLACAARVPTLGIFTVTRADEWGPYGTGNQVVHAQHREPADVAREVARLIHHLATTDSEYEWSDRTVCPSQ